MQHACFRCTHSALEHTSGHLTVLREAYKGTHTQTGRGLKLDFHTSFCRQSLMRECLAQQGAHSTAWGIAQEVYHSRGSTGNVWMAYSTGSVSQEVQHRTHCLDGVQACPALSVSLACSSIGTGILRLHARSLCFELLSPLRCLRTP